MSKLHYAYEYKPCGTQSMTYTMRLVVDEDSALATMVASEPVLARDWNSAEDEQAYRGLETTMSDELKAENEGLRRRIAELEAQRWIPVPDGEIVRAEWDSPSAVTVYQDGECLVATDIDGDVLLPNDVRLCRRLP